MKTFLQPTAYQPLAAESIPVLQMPPGMELSWGLGDVIRKVREQRNLTQEDLAAAAGIHKATVLRVEAGGQTKSETIAALAKALSVSIADLYAALPNADDNVQPGTIDVSGHVPNDLPVIAEGEASPIGSLFWDEEGAVVANVTDRMSRPHDVSDPSAYGIKVRGDSMEPMFRTGMRLVVSPNVPVGDSDPAYVQLQNGERLIKLIHRADGGYVLESVNPNYKPRFVKKDDVEHIHRIAYARFLR